MATSGHICQICGGTDVDDYVNTSEAHYVRCDHCGLIFNARDFSQEQVVSDYYDQQQYFEGYLARRGHKIQSSRRCLELIKDLKPTGLLVDIGCGIGDTLAAAEGLGYRATGIDIGAYPVQFCREMGLDARVGSITETGLPDECADIVTAWDVLEHIPVTANGLAEINRILKPEGLLVFVVPNAWYIKAQLLRGKYRCYAGKWARTHLVYHNPHTINLVLQQNGFRQLPIPWVVRNRLTGGLRAASHEIMLCLPRLLFRNLRACLRLNRNLFVIAQKKQTPGTGGEPPATDMRRGRGP